MRQFKIEKNITNRAGDSISRYLIDIAHIDLLHQDEEVKLAMMAQQGDAKAIEKLVRTNLRFVVSVAKQYQNKGMALSDLISEGNLGLIKAAQRFDYTKGFKFISFAVYWIRQSIILALSEQKRLIRLPGNQINDINKVSKATDKLEQTLERTPTLIELAEMLELSEEKVADILYNGGVSISVDGSNNPHTDTSLLDVLIDKNSLYPISQLFKDSLSIDLIRLLSALPEKQQVILKCFYGLDNYPELGFEDIGLKVGLTSERVRQLKNKAIETLKQLCNVSKMGDYFNIA